MYVCMGGLDNADNVIYLRKVKAKKQLKAQGYEWYYEKVLIIYKEITSDFNIKSDLTKYKQYKNLSYSIEDDIGGLLGLFNS